MGTLHLRYRHLGRILYLVFDISGVLGLMLAGALGVEWAKKAIIIFAPVVFVLAAIVYFILSGRIGLDDFSDSDGEE